MDEWPRVAVEINRLLGVEEHVLAGINLEDEVFEGTHSHDAGNLLCLFLGEVFQLVDLVAAHLAGISNHLGNEVICIHHGAFAALHLAVGQFHHAVGEVHKVLAPLEAKFVKQDREHLEVIVLLIAHHIDHLVNGKVLKAQLGRSDVLRHVNTGTIGAQQQFLVQAFAGEVCPDRAILAAVEEPFVEALHHLFLAFEVGLALVVNLIKAYT